MIIPIEIKQKITHDWLARFPELSAYTANKFYKVVGPVVVGIELFNLPHNCGKYRPYFVSYPLWQKDIKECMDAPLFLEEIENKKRLQLNIPYLKHEYYFNEAVECFRNQVLLPMEGDVTISEIIKTVGHLLNHPLTSCSPVMQVQLYMLKFYSALYINDLNLVNNILEEIYTVGSSWAPNLFEWRFGNFDTWFENLRNNMNCRGDFLNQIELNKQTKKLIKLHVSNLIP